MFELEAYVRPYETAMIRRSRPEVFCKEVVLRNFAKFTEKKIVTRVFFNKVAGFLYPLCNHFKGFCNIYAR